VKNGYAPHHEKCKNIHVQHQVILDLINSKEVQRLRRIKQLGTTSYTFHGAEQHEYSYGLDREKLFPAAAFDIYKSLSTS
jgi:hypothetical protein